VRKTVLILLLAFAVLLTGCGGQTAGESSAGVKPESAQNANNGVLSEEEAKQALLTELDAEDSSEFTVGLLREAELGEAKVYAFELVGKSGGAGTVYFVHSESGKVYPNSNELLLDKFKESEDKEQYKKEKYIDADIYYLAMKSINDPEELTWEAYIVADAAYSDLAAAKKAVVANHVQNHPVLSLLGKHIDEIVAATGLDPQIAEVEDIEGVENYTIHEINFEDALVFFDNEDIASQIFIEGQREFLGVQLGNTFDQISEVLGLPESISEDPFFEDVHTMRYVFDDFTLEFYAESREAPTASAMVTYQN
jgi:hypothetical protein